jgi:type I restriction enzyme S subunit
MIEGLKPYSQYKQTGSTWLGAIPSHWEEVPLGRVLVQRIEQNRPVKTTEILSLSLRQGVIPYSEKKSGGNKAKSDLSAYTLAYPGDIVLNSMNVVVGSVGLSKYYGAVSPVYYVLHTRKRMDLIQYFDAIFQDKSFQQSLWGLGNGIMFLQSKTTGKFNTIRLRIPMSKLRRVIVTLPPPDEQAAIVKFLDYANGKIERAIRAKRKLIGLLNEQKQAIIHRAVTRGLDPTVKLKSSGVPWLGDVPEHWDCRAFARMSRVVRGASPRPAGDSRYFNGSHTPWVTVGEVTKDKDIYLTKTETMLKEAGADHSVRFSAGTLIMTNSGATLGVPKILSIEACANDGIVAFLNLQAVLDKPFAYYYLSTLTTRLRDELRQGGTQPNLNTGIVKRIVCPLPPLEEQRQIFKHIEIHLSPINTAMGRTEHEIDLLREYRTTLIAEVVTGKLDVREAAKRLPDQADEPLAPDDSMDELIEAEIDQEVDA